MAWTANRTWTAGEVVTASIMNTYIRDNLNYLKGVGQVPTIESGLVIDNTDGDEYLKLPLLSTAETGTVLNAEGKAAFDEQTHRIKFRDRTSVRSLVSTADVDDTPVNGATTDPVSSNWAYDFQNTLTTAGDIAYATSAGVWARLGIGAANQLLKTNAGATAPEWASVAIVTSAGTYTGNSSANRAIPHGLAVTPKFVFIADTTASDSAGGSTYHLITGIARIYHTAGGANSSLGVTVMDGTNFYVGNATAYASSANNNAVTYSWVAFG